MSKKIVILFLCIVMCLSFASCSSEEEETSSTSSSPSAPQTSSKQEINIPKITMVEDIINYEGIYCLHSDGSISKANKLVQIEEDTSIYAGGAPLVIDRTKGDLLIYVGDMVYLTAGNGEQFEMDYYAEQFYWSGEKVDLMEIEEFEGVGLEGVVKESGIFYWMNVDSFFEPFGLTVHLDVVDDGKGYILSKEPLKYSYGYYEGTKWVGTNASNDSLFYDAFVYDFKQGYAFRTDVIKGKNGYFTIDLEEIEAGLYLNEFKGDNHIYAIEII